VGETNTKVEKEWTRKGNLEGKREEREDKRIRG
jgi:hypothetical protein